MKILTPIALTCTLLGAATACSPVTTAAKTIAHGIETTPSTPAPTTAQEPKTGPVKVNGKGWTEAGGLEGTMPAPGTCHLRYTTNHEPLPDPTCTPGAVDSTVIQANLKETVCRKGGYTSSVRPPAAMTDKAKRQILAAYGIPASDASKYELDHLEPLGAAAGSSDIRNLWPEPNTFIDGKTRASGFVHNDKDAVEANALAALCTGKAKLEDIRHAMATDWTTANYPAASDSSGNDD